MSGIMKSSLFFTKKVGSYSDGWGEVTGEDRTWEQSYRDRWAHDKNCSFYAWRKLHGLLQLAGLR